MRTTAVLKILLATTQQPISAKFCKGHVTKLHIWKIPDGELPLFWKIVISQYLSETSSDLDKIWYTEVDSDSMCVIVFIFRILPDGRFYRHQLSLHVLRLDISFKFYPLSLLIILIESFTTRSFYLLLPLLFFFQGCLSWVYHHASHDQSILLEIDYNYRFFRPLFVTPLR